MIKSRSCNKRAHTRGSEDDVQTRSCKIDKAPDNFSILSLADERSPVRRLEFDNEFNRGPGVHSLVNHDVNLLNNISNRFRLIRGDRKWKQHLSIK